MVGVPNMGDFVRIPDDLSFYIAISQIWVILLVKFMFLNLDFAVKSNYWKALIELGVKTVKHDYILPP